VGAYISQSDIEAVFGVQNVGAWSHVDSTADTSTADTARVAVAISYAESYVEERLSGGQYTVPFSGTIPQTLKDILAKLAGAWLYTTRGIRGGEQADDRVVSFVGTCNELLDLYAAGTRRFTSMARATTSGNTPFVASGGAPMPKVEPRPSYVNRGWSPFCPPGVMG
jgi:hypothetical protein